MDPMKQNDIQETKYTDPITDEEIRNDEIQDPLYAESLENGVEIIDPEEEKDDIMKKVPPIYEEEPLLDIDDGEEGFQLTAPQEREAELLAVQKSVAWMKGRGSYTIDELKKVKAELLREARREVALKSTHAKHEQ